MFGKRIEDYFCTSADAEQEYFRLIAGFEEIYRAEQVFDVALELFCRLPSAVTAASHIKPHRCDGIAAEPLRKLDKHAMRAEPVAVCGVYEDDGCFCAVLYMRR